MAGLLDDQKNYRDALAQYLLSEKDTPIRSYGARMDAAGAEQSDNVEDRRNQSMSLLNYLTRGPQAPWAYRGIPQDLNALMPRGAVPSRSTIDAPPMTLEESARIAPREPGAGGIFDLQAARNRNIDRMIPKSPSSYPDDAQSMEQAYGTALKSILQLGQSVPYGWRL